MSNFSDFVKIHSTVQTHLSNDAKHREINDSGTGATDLWSASKMNTELTGKSNTGHDHDADYLQLTGGIVTGGLTVHGDMTVSGTTFTTQHETVEITDNVLLINNGEVGNGVTVSGGLAGIEVDRGSATNYRFMFVEANDNFQVGEIGDLQAVATREDSPVASGIPFWNPAANRFDTRSDFFIDSNGVLTMSKQSAVLAWSGLDNNQSIPTNTDTKVTLGAAIFDIQNELDTDNDKFVAKTAGIYMMVGKVRWQSNVAGNRTDLRLKINGTSRAHDTTYLLGNDMETRWVHLVYYLNVGDEVEMWVEQDSGVAQEIYKSYSYGVSLCIYKVA